MARKAFISGDFIGRKVISLKKGQKLNDITEVIKSITPGAVGAVSGVVYTRGHWLKRVANIFVSSATVYYTYEYVAATTGLPGGMVSFFLGLFAAPTIDTLISELYTFKPSKVALDWLRRKAGVDK